MKVFGMLGLLLAGVFSLLLQTGALARAVTPELDRLPARLGAFEHVETIEFDPSVLGDLPPERHHFAAWRAPSGVEGVLYVAYFQRGRRWSGRPHPVDACYRSQGWDELEVRHLELPSGATIAARHYEREGREVQVVHWIQRPGELPAAGVLGGTAKRLGGLPSLRQDAASAYWEFPWNERPADAELIDASQALVTTLEQLW